MMKPGKYWIGDLCYVMNAEWDEFCALTLDGDNVKEGEFSLADGRKFAFASTKYGDGSYRDGRGREYGVDAGLIGCILLSDIDQTNQSNMVDSGHIVEMDYAFSIQGALDSRRGLWDGVIHIGHEVAIDTGDEEDEDSYDDGCDQYEDEEA